jgi:hypothetical protein
MKKLPPQSGYSSGGMKMASAAATPASTFSGVSIACMLSFLIKYCPQIDDSSDSQRHTTRDVARGLKRRMKDADESGPHVDSLVGQQHLVTGGDVTGRAGVYVAHSWDSNFHELVEALVSNAQGDLDKRYFIDVFSNDLHTIDDDPVATVQRHVAAADTVLLVLDTEGETLRRLWVVFEALLAFQAGKLHVRCTAPDGFGASEAALRDWEGRIDRADWALAECSRKSDDKRLRAFAEKEWEVGGKGVERMLAQLRKTLRQDVYSQILVAAVQDGDKATVSAALDLGADPEAQDALGNTVEALAAFNGREDIENMLFERRMRQQFHPSLSEWALDPRQLAKSDQAGWFVTEYLGGEPELDDGPDEARESDEEHIVASKFLHLSEQSSTCTSRFSSHDELSQNDSHSSR